MAQKNNEAAKVQPCRSLRHERLIERIPAEECLDRRIYEIRCRNLRYGVFQKSSKGFIGIREKFGSKYLFVEYHCDKGRPYGTVSKHRDTGVDLPKHIDLRLHHPGSYGSRTGKAVYYQRKATESDRGVGSWYYMIDDHVIEEEDTPSCKNNTRLFDYLAGFEDNDPSL